MIWGIASLFFAFFLGPLARGRSARLGLAALYLLASLFFLNAMLDLQEPLYYHFVPQTLALFDLSFTADTLSLGFALIISLIGSIVMAYSASYIESPDAPRFNTLMNFFALSMLGLVFSNNLLGIFIFWEFTAICSYFLIAFDGASAEARRASWQALIVNSLGGLALLFGFLMLGGIGGSYDLLYIRMPQEHPWLGTCFLLICAGVATKTALFPFHFWLPAAMTAPSPASAYLHAATMVKAGIFLLFRLNPYLGNQPLWSKVLIPLGLITLVLSCLLILFERDLKRILAYTTTATLGFLVYLIGKNTAATYFLAFLWIFVHSLYKAPLFLLAGNIERYSGSRDVTTLSQLYPRLKGSFVLCILGIFSLFGLPPALTSFSKKMSFDFLATSPLDFSVLVFFFAVTGSIGFTLLAMFLKEREKARVQGTFFNDDDDPAALWIPAAVAFVLSLLVGLRFTRFCDFLKSGLGQLIAQDFDAVGAQTLVGPQMGTIASVAILFFAGFFAAAASRLRKKPLTKLRAFNLERLWNLSFDRFLGLSKTIFNVFQNNRLDLYCLTFFAFLIFGLTRVPVTSVDLALPLLSLKFTLVTPFEVALIAAMILASTLVLRAQSNLSALLVLGVVGFGISFLYLVNAAPDLALTQFLVESLTLMILVLTFKFLPKIPYRVVDKRLKVIYATVSLIVGIGAGALTFLASSSLRSQTLSRYFGEKSLTLAHGKNVVNVTIVDFRGFDTLGEVTVLILAAVGIASLLNRKRAEVIRRE